MRCISAGGAISSARSSAYLCLILASQGFPLIGSGFFCPRSARLLFLGIQRRWLNRTIVVPTSYSSIRHIYLPKSPISEGLSCDDEWRPIFASFWSPCCARKSWRSQSYRRGKVWQLAVESMLVRTSKDPTRLHLISPYGCRQCHHCEPQFTHLDIGGETTCPEGFWSEINNPRQHVLQGIDAIEMKEFSSYWLSPTLIC